MRLKVLIILIMIACPVLKAQYYTRDIGIRAGEGVIISYRQFFNEEMAVEGLAGFRDNSFKITGLREYFMPLMISRTDNLKFLYGYGVHAGISYTNKYEFFNKLYRHSRIWNPQFGLDAIVGIEYSAADLPIQVSANFLPYFEFSLDRYFYIRPLNWQVALKYRF